MSPNEEWNIWARLCPDGHKEVLAQHPRNCNVWAHIALNNDWSNPGNKWTEPADGAALLAEGWVEHGFPVALAEMLKIEVAE